MKAFDIWLQLSDNSAFDYTSTSIGSAFILTAAIFDITLKDTSMVVAIVVGLTKIIPEFYKGYKWLEKRAKNRRANDDSSIE